MSECVVVRRSKSKKWEKMSHGKQTQAERAKFSGTVQYYVYANSVGCSP